MLPFWKKTKQKTWNSVSSPAWVTAGAGLSSELSSRTPQTSLIVFVSTSKKAHDSLFKRPSEILEWKQHLSFIPRARCLTGNRAPNTLWFRVPVPPPWHDPCLQNRGGKILISTAVWSKRFHVFHVLRTSDGVLNHRQLQLKTVKEDFCFGFSLSLSLPNHLFSAGTYLPRILNNFVTFPLDRGLWISIRFPQL